MRTVCVVDDDELIRAHIAEMLGRSGFKVIEAGHAEEALSVVRDEQPFAAVIDIVMPDKDGVELIGDIRRKWPSTRLIAMSGGGRLGPGVFLEAAKRIGADVCLPKPLQLETLLAALDG